MQPHIDKQVFNSKSTTVQTLLRYPTILFLLFTSSFVFGMHGADRDDRCELQGFFGITHDEPDNEKLASLGYSTKGGTIVTNVIGCTAALNAGIQPMDYLFEVNGKSASSSTQFFCLMGDFKPGDSFRVGLMRAGEKKTVTLTLGRRSEACHQESPFPKRGFFGINDTESDRRPGVLLDVSSGGPVASLGLQDGDRLLRINGYPISDWSDLSIVKRLISDTDNVTFDVIRDGNDLSFTGAIPEQQHQSQRWNSTNGIIAECAEEVKEAIAEIDFDEIEREIETAIRSSDIRDETEDAVEDAMEAVREALSGLRNRGFDTEDDERTPNIDPMEMDARIEQMSESDISTVEGFNVDMPEDKGLAVNNFSASPNPNQGQFRLSFELPSRGDTRLAIYSATGREVYAYDLGEYSGMFTDELDIMRNGPGTYFLVVRQDRQAFVRKLVLIER